MGEVPRQRHAARLAKLLREGRHAMAAQHIRACLVKQGVQPGGGGRGGGDDSSEGSGS